MQLRLDQASFSTMRVPTLRDLHLGFRALGFKGFRVQGSRDEGLGFSGLRFRVKVEARISRNIIAESVQNCGMN